MSERPNDFGRGTPPADPLRFLRQLAGREPTDRQKARIVDLQRRFDLRSGDSIFIIISILEVYLNLVEMACLRVSRSTRKTLWTASLTAIISSAVMILPHYLSDPNIWSALGWKAAPATAEDRLTAELPLRAYVNATMRRMPDADISRIASSEAMVILFALPHASDGQLAAIVKYLQATPAPGTH